MPQVHFFNILDMDTLNLEHEIPFKTFGQQKSTIQSHDKITTSHKKVNGKTTNSHACTL